MRISDALKQVKDLKVDFGVGGTLNITYRPPSWTPAELDQLKKERNIGTIVDQIRKLVVAWDLTDDYQKLIPLEEPPVAPVEFVLDPETGAQIAKQGEPVEIIDPLMHVPLSIYMTIIRAINEDGKPDPQQ